MPKQFIAYSAAALLSGCGIIAGFMQLSSLKPLFDAGHNPVFVERYASGPVSPAYVHQDELTVFADGTWAATRSYPYATPASTSVYSGAMATTEVQHLVDLAFASPGTGQARFVDLPARLDDGAIGGGRRSITLLVKGGSQSVEVLGKAPESFLRLETAIASATMPLWP